MNDRPLHVAIAPQPALNCTNWQPRQVTWDQYVERVTRPPGTTKDCGGYVFGQLTAPRRLKDTIHARSAITLDADHAGDIIALADTFQAFHCVTHTTWSHTPHHPRARVIIPTDRDMTPDEYRTVAEELIATAGPDLFDAGSSQPERLMFWPSTPDPETYVAPFVNAPQPGDTTPTVPAPVDALLKQAADRARARTPEQATEWVRRGHTGEATHQGTRRAADRALHDLAQAPEGARNTTAFPVACWLIELSNDPDRGYPRAAAHTDFMSVATKTLGGGETEARAVWNSASRKAGTNIAPKPGAAK
jgi:hypothetical protein